MSDRQFVKFADLDREAADLEGEYREGTLRYGVNYVIAHAEDNAAEEAGRIASIESMLCYPSGIITRDVQKWFLARGIKF